MVGGVMESYVVTVLNIGEIISMDYMSAFYPKDFANKKTFGKYLEFFDEVFSRIWYFVVLKFCS